MKNANEIIRVALVGQPNCGKSTLFNAVAGFKVNTGNFPGTTVSFAETKVLVAGKDVLLIDLPGTYSMTSLDLSEKVTRDYLLSDKIDIIINVIDTSMLARSLELTLQLIEMGIPMVVALNMMDEAKRKGMEIDIPKLAGITGLDIFSIIAVQGVGVEKLFIEAIKKTEALYTPILPRYDTEIEGFLNSIITSMPTLVISQLQLNARFIATRLLDADADFSEKIKNIDGDFYAFIGKTRQQLAEHHGWPENTVFASHRHALVLDLYEDVVNHYSSPKKGLRDKLDSLLTNPFTGSIIVLLSLFLMFFVSFQLGNYIAALLGSPFAYLREIIATMHGGIGASIASGLSDGLEAGIGIVLPYLVPLLFLLAIYEDSGILPRIAFMADGILHRFGLHGKSIVPLILGCGCNVPALMATRNLDNDRDRRLALLIIPFVTCSARTVVILGLVGKYLGAGWATVIYIGGVVVALLVSYLLSKVNVNLDRGIIMEVPPLRIPQMNILLKKVWLRMYEFLLKAWPILIISSMLLSISSLIGIDSFINNIFSPLTVTAMKLPVEVGIPLFLGLLRKELALVMLATALGTTDIASVLTAQQIITLTVFTVLYIPCLATLATLKSEGGWKIAMQSAALNFSVALIVSVIVAHV